MSHGGPITILYERPLVSSGSSLTAVSRRNLVVRRLSHGYGFRTRDVSGRAVVRGHGPQPAASESSCTQPDSPHVRCGHVGCRSASELQRGLFDGAVSGSLTSRRSTSSRV